jgi:hypothetical protein
VSTADLNVPLLLRDARRISPGRRSAELRAVPQVQVLEAADLGSGRGFTYEWEQFLGQVFQQLQVVVHEQAAPAAVWTIEHGLGTKPNVLLVDETGQQLLAEVHFSDDNTVVVIHGAPTTGIAYLRA